MIHVLSEDQLTTKTVSCVCSWQLGNEDFGSGHVCHLSLQTSGPSWRLKKIKYKYKLQSS